MKIDINPGARILDLKKQFHAYFPYLKIEFFSHSHLGNSGTEKSAMFDSSVAISELNPEIQYGSVEFNETNTVLFLEQLFRDKFGLYLQVFRKSGNVYLETSSTDHWGLDQQNEEAKAHDINGYNGESRDMTDRDQWE